MRDYLADHGEGQIKSAKGLGRMWPDCVSPTACAVLVVVNTPAGRAWVCKVADQMRAQLACFLSCMLNALCSVQEANALIDVAFIQQLMANACGCQKWLHM